MQTYCFERCILNDGFYQTFLVLCSSILNTIIYSRVFTSLYRRYPSSLRDLLRLVLQADIPLLLIGLRCLLSNQRLFKVTFMDTLSNNSTNNQRYFTVWRWHFYAGIFVAPFLVVLAITALGMLFMSNTSVVFNNPPASKLTRIPYCPSSLARLRVSPINADLAVV